MIKCMSQTLIKNVLLQSLTSKKNYLKQNGTNYNLFILPDKSVVLNKYLTFKNNTPIRHVENLSEYLIDLKDVIIEEDYLLNDTNVSMCLV